VDGRAAGVGAADGRRARRGHAATAIVFVDHGQRIELEAEVVRFEPPAYLEVSLRGDGVAATSQPELEEIEGGTRLTA
jgi:hypothetical protein